MKEELEQLNKELFSLKDTFFLLKKEMNEFNSQLEYENQKIKIYLFLFCFVNVILIILFRKN